MMDACFRSAGYALVIEGNTDQKIQSKRKKYTLVAFGPEIIFPPATQNAHILERIFGNLHGISSVCTHSVGRNKANKCSDRLQICHTFLPNERNPPALRNASDYVLQINFKIAHITGSVNTAADFLSRLELKVTEKIRLKIREDIQTTRIEVTTSSSEVAYEEQLFFPQADK